MNSTLSEADRVRLSKLLGMCGSDFDGERAAAALAADRLIRDRGMTWEQVLIPSPPIEKPTRASWEEPESRAWDQPSREEPWWWEKPPHRDWRQTRALCLNHEWDLSNWELEFLQGLDRFPRLSAKQRAVLDRIAKRVLREDAL
jgi:hypothetical protein